MTDEKKSQLLLRLASEPSDTKLANEFGLSRKSVWRLRQEPKAKIAKPAPKVKIAKPAPKANPPTDRRETTLPPPTNGVQAVVIPPTLPLTSETFAENDVAEAVPQEPTLKKMDSETKALRPKVEEVTTLAYFAIQIFKGENFKHIVQVVLEAASKQGILFRKLQVLDVTMVGAITFIRLRADLTNFDALARGLKNRAVITPMGGSFYVHLVDGRNAKVPGATMCSAAKVGFGQTYVGTRIKRWKAQFAA